MSADDRLNRAAEALRSFEPSEFEGQQQLQARWREKAARAVLLAIRGVPGDRS